MKMSNTKKKEEVEDSEVEETIERVRRFWEGNISLMTKHFAWCHECNKRLKVDEVYYDRARIVVTLSCGHEYYAGTGEYY